eukprot:s182_g6.t1
MATITKAGRRGHAGDVRATHERGGGPGKTRSGTADGTGGGSTTEAGTSKPQQGRKGQRRAGPTTGTGSRRLQSWFRAAGGSIPGRDGPTNVEDRDQAGGHSQDHAPVYRVGALCQDGGPTVIPTMIATSKKWKEEITKPDCPFGNVSLRATLFWSLMDMLLHPLRNLTEDIAQQATDAGWMNANQTWNFSEMVANPEDTGDRRRAHSPQNGDGDHNTGETEGSGHERGHFSVLFQSSIDTKYAGQHGCVDVGRVISQTASTPVLRTPGRTTGQSVLQMCGLQLRKEGFKRSAAVQKLAELVR